MHAGLILGVRQVKTATMNARPSPSLADSIAAAQAWWREAGVDLDFQDEPRAWLASPAADEAPSPVATPAPPSPPPIPAIGGDRAAWPQDLTAFHQWWLSESSLDEGGTYPRIAARGEPGAPLMMLVPMPEAEDSETLLSGPQGRLLHSLALAMGANPDGIYVAAALPRHMAMPDWPGLAARGQGDILSHQIELAAPERLLVLGRGILSLLGHDPAQGAPVPNEFTIQDRSVPLLASFSPARLLENARLRAGLWRRWLNWTGK